MAWVLEIRKVISDTIWKFILHPLIYTLAGLDSGTRYSLISIRLRRFFQVDFLGLSISFPQTGHLFMVGMTKRFVLHFGQVIFSSPIRLTSFN